MPAPSMTTDLPAPTFAGQSPGRGERVNAGGGVLPDGGDDAPPDADDDPQAARLPPRPMAAMVRSIADVPAARPMDARNSRRRTNPSFLVMLSPPNRMPSRSTADTTSITTDWTHKSGPGFFDRSAECYSANFRARSDSAAMRPKDAQPLSATMRSNIARASSVRPL